LDVYRDLQEHLDEMPVGYPRTESGVEISLLQKLFTPEEARLACNLGMLPIHVKEISENLKNKGWDEDKVAETLKTMGKKGLILWSHKKGEDYYCLTPMVVGIYELQLNKLNVDFLHDFEQYLDEGLKAELVGEGKTPQSRTIPIEESVEHLPQIASFDEVRQLVENQSKFAVADCICRQAQALLDNECKHSKGFCFQFGTGAYNFINLGLAKEITKEEALELLKQAQDEGLVLQPTNAIKNISICSCCGCSCEYLRTLNKYEKPARMVASNFHAEVDSEECIGCGKCEERCHMGAITVNEETGIAEVNLDRCIGCGVCVPVCASEAVKMEILFVLPFPVNTIDVIS